MKSLDPARIRVVTMSSLSHTRRLGDGAIPVGGRGEGGWQVDFTPGRTRRATKIGLPLRP